MQPPKTTLDLKKKKTKIKHFVAHQMRNFLMQGGV